MKPRTKRILTIVVVVVIVVLAAAVCYWAVTSTEMEMLRQHLGG